MAVRQRALDREPAGASSFSTARNASILASGQCDRLAKVRLLTLSPTRKLSRSNIAGGEFRFGTRVTYMNPENHAESRNASQNGALHAYKFSAIFDFLQSYQPLQS